MTQCSMTELTLKNVMTIHLLAPDIPGAVVDREFELTKKNVPFGNLGGPRKVEEGR